MKKYYLLVAIIVFGLMVQLCSFTALAANDEKNIAEVLNSFHQAAADAQAEPYFNLMSQDAIFLGTDASERWSKEEFKAFVDPYFLKGTGWLYIPTERNISLVKQGQVAFFDELLLSETYGTCRGSGVLIKTNQGWKISQYNLSIPMPNGIAKALVKQIKSFEPSK
ncbi:protein with SnoaL 3 domain, NTF 2 superfamily [Colwellia sp. 75C3]|uniref:nuclear transport factor 2 family protein n=1 Tax=Colwellia sp. 75C3 TaxID=888425 RepID=UPI000C323E3B|nr:nuclear transport factor 2 family protein [Colwellia sp. 75C3]PKG86171.1 protein with SnoaL 3 domain, NTF 2 superfamily [Colwellia sp. 75C3]